MKETLTPEISAFRSVEHLTRLYLLHCVRSKRSIDPQEYKNLLSTFFRSSKQSVRTHLSHESFLQLCDCFCCTVLVYDTTVDFWPGCQQWFNVNAEVPQGLGGIPDMSYILGSSCIINFEINSIFFDEIHRLFKMALNSPYPTRIIFRSKEASLVSTGLKRLILKYVPTSNNFVYIFQNNTAKAFFPTSRKHIQ